MLDKPKFRGTEIDLGAVDLKFNHLGNRIAISSLDSKLKIFNLHPETGLTLYKEIFNIKQSDIWKLDFNPNGNEVLTGTISLIRYDISTGNKVNEYNKSSRYI